LFQYFIAFPRVALIFNSGSPLPGVRRKTGHYPDLPGFKNLEGL